MSRVCQISGKRPKAGNKRSHSCRATKRVFKPNLVVKKIKDPKTGRLKKMKIAASALRTLDKKSC